MSMALEIFGSLAREAKLGQEIASGARRLTRATAGLHEGLLIPGGFFVRGGPGLGNPHIVHLSGEHFVGATATTMGQYRRIVEGQEGGREDDLLPQTNVSWNGFDAYHKAHNQAHGTEAGFIPQVWHERTQRGPVIDIRQALETAGVRPADFPEWLETQDHLENILIAGDELESLRIINDPRDPLLLQALTTGAQDVYGWRKHGTVSGRLAPDEAWFGQPWEAGPKPVDWGPGSGWDKDLRNVAGNVWEWVEDWLGEVCPQGAAILFDPPPPAEGTYRLLLGGSWDGLGRALRAAYRHDGHADGQGDNGGARVGWPPRTRQG